MGSFTLLTRDVKISVKGGVEDSRCGEPFHSTNFADLLGAARLRPALRGYDAEQEFVMRSLGRGKKVSRHRTQYLRRSASNDLATIKRR